MPRSIEAIFEPILEASKNYYYRKLNLTFYVRSDEFLTTEIYSKLNEMYTLGVHYNNITVNTTHNVFINLITKRV